MHVYYQSPFCEARRASLCHSPQTTYSSKTTCCILSAQISAIYVVVTVGMLTTEHSIVEIIDWWWSNWQIWYPSWSFDPFLGAPSAIQKSDALIGILSQHALLERVPHRVGWNHNTIDYHWSMCIHIDTWINMLMFNAIAYNIIHS